MAGKKGMKTYSTSTKEQAVRMHIEEGLTIREITTLLKIADKQRVKKWCATYRKEGLLGLQSQPKGRSKKYKLSLEEEIKRLKMENDLLRSFRYEVERG